MASSSDLEGICIDVIEAALDDTPLSEIEEKLDTDRSWCLKRSIGRNWEQQIKEETQAAGRSLARRYRSQICDKVQKSRVKRALKGGEGQMRKSRRSLILSRPSSCVRLMRTLDMAATILRELGEFPALTDYCEYYRQEILRWIGHLSRANTRPECFSKGYQSPPTSWPTLCIEEVLRVGPGDQRFCPPLERLKSLPDQFLTPTEGKEKVFRFDLRLNAPNDPDLFRFPREIPTFAAAVFDGKMTQGRRMIQEEMKKSTEGGAYFRVGVNVESGGMGVFPCLVREQFLRARKEDINKQINRGLWRHVEDKVLPRLRQDRVVADVQDQEGRAVQMIFRV